MKRLAGKVAVVYGNGTIGATIAAAFAREGAHVYLAGRTQEQLAVIADSIRSAGGAVETTLVDALDEAAVENHLRNVVEKAGSVDISFNAIGIAQTGIQGIALTDLSVDSFIQPIGIYLKAHFITARAAARYMSKQGTGVILMHTPNASHISPPFVGGMVPAWSGMEGLCRSLSVELGERGVRSVCLLTTGIPETALIDEVWEIHGKAHGISFEQFNAMMEAGTHRKRLTTLKELADAAVFVASNEGTAVSGTVLNLTAGMVG